MKEDREVSRKSCWSDYEAWRMDVRSVLDSPRASPASSTMSIYLVPYSETWKDECMLPTYKV